MYVSVCEAKKHLQIDHQFTGDDLYISMLIDASVSAIQRNLSINFDSHLLGGDLASPLKMGVLLMVGQLYANREPTTSTSINKIPYTLDYLLSSFRQY